MRIEETKTKLLARQEKVQEWLSCEAPYTVADQRHLDAHSREQAYWHFGYQQALADVVEMLNGPDGPPGNEDKSDPFQRGG